VGLEITRHVVRGVRLAHDHPNRVTDAAEAAIARFDDDASVLDALIRVHAQLGQTADTTRVAWFAEGATIQRLDATGRNGPELNAMRHELAQSSGITSTMLVDVDARRWMIVLRWDHQTAVRLEHLTERAGFVDASVEPAPVALARVLAGSVSVARRDASEDHSWVVVVDGPVPVAAGVVPQAARRHPDLVVASGSTGLHRLDDVLPATELAETVDELASAAIDADGRRGELELGLHVASSPYPPFPVHDLRSPQRQAVALGAAVGAAGLAGRLRPVDVLAPTYNAPATVRRPWAIERVTDLPPTVRSRSRPWWRRRLAEMTGDRRR
jgi:hypothetical protein